MQEPALTVAELPPVPDSVDIPTERVYDAKPAAELDQSLCDAIDAATQSENDYLAKLLAFELASHYYETR